MNGAHDCESGRQNRVFWFEPVQLMFAGKNASCLLKHYQMAVFFAEMYFSWHTLCDRVFETTSTPICTVTCFSSFQLAVRTFHKNGQKVFL